MRKAVLALTGAVALSIGSAASATVTIVSSTGLTNPTPSVVSPDGPITTINFGQSSVPSSFTDSLTIGNTLGGLYNFVIDTSTPGITFSAGQLTGAGGPYSFILSPDSQSLALHGASLVAGNYTLTFSGANANTDGGTFTGNLTISPLPEPATWAMMLLGFGAIGLTVRSRRKPVLAQIA